MSAMTIPDPVTALAMQPHNPAAEAAAKLGPGFAARVLEPSPPTVAVAPWFADDPAARGTADGVPVITPTSGGDRSWDDILGDRPELAEWAAERWLGARPSLPQIPAGYPAARDGYHRLAYGIVAEARCLANTKFGLRYTRGGYGTPFYGADEQVRVEPGLLVHQQGHTARMVPITTLRAATAFIDVKPGVAASEHNSPPLGDLDEDLGATVETGEFLGSWFGFSWAVLEELRLTDGAVDIGRTQLWPGHFDPALEMGDEASGGRASFGASPGDKEHDEPYLYVGAAGDVDRDDPYWNETTFAGASMSYRELSDTDDAVAAALGFFRGGYTRLNP
jgi:hypothetical protein